jgi:hypothetical protein
MIGLRAYRVAPALLVLWPALLVLAAGCYRPFQSETLLMQRAVSVRELYRDPAFGKEQLELHGVSFLSARLNFDDQTYGRALVQGLLDAVAAELPHARLVHPNVMARYINEYGLTHAYALMLDEYDETNILEGDTLAEIAEAVGVRYFALPILVSFGRQTSTRFSVFGFRLGKTHSAHAIFQLQIWDGTLGQVVWEGISDLTLAQDGVREKPIRFEEIVAATWTALIREIPSEPESAEEDAL